MSADPQHPGIHARPGPAREASLSQLAEQSDLDERADLEEDRRRQRELDHGELGGDA